MIRLTFLIFILFFLSNCSFSEKSRIWNDKEEKIENQNIKKLFAKEEKNITEFNPDLKLDLSKLKFNNSTLDNQNNFGAQIYENLNKKTISYKFSKIEDPSNLNYKPLFLSDGLIFFDKKGAITRYNNSGKVIWKKNHYSKSEKKLRPKLFFALDGENLLIADSIAKYYSINIKSGELNWLKNGAYSFNSEIKKENNKFFVVDYNNTLRAFSTEDGSESMEFSNGRLFCNVRYKKFSYHHWRFGCF